MVEGRGSNCPSHPEGRSVVVPGEPGGIRHFWSGIHVPGYRRRVGLDAASFARASLASGLVAWSLLVGSPALANMAAPWTDGDSPGEPHGLAGIRVENEKLVLDIARMAGRRVPVTAVYSLDNPGPEFMGDLVFVAPFMASLAATLDRTPLDVTIEEDVPVPPGFAPPSHSPPLPPWDLPEGVPINYPSTLEREEGPTCDIARFQVRIPPGKHELAIGYTMTPPTHEAGGIYKAYQLPYVLSPARTWASFGKLEVVVLLPPGWEAASWPALERVPEGLSGTFDGLPGDTLAVTARPVLAAWRECIRSSTPLMGIALALLLSTLLGLKRGRISAERGGANGKTLFAGLWVALLSALLSVLTMLLSLWVGGVVVDGEHLANSASYRQMMSALFLVPAALFAAVLSGLLALHVARRKTLARLASREATSR